MVGDEKRPLVVFDGDCGICSRLAAFAARLVGDRAEVVPWQHLDLAEVGLTRQQVQEAAWWIGADGDTRGGHEAAARILQVAGGPWRPLGWLINHRPLRWPAAFIYRWVARNRRRLPGGTPACALPSTNGGVNDGPGPPAAEQPRRGGGPGRGLSALVLTLAVVAGAMGIESWPLTGWRLFSHVRGPTQAAWEVVYLDGEGETAVPFGDLGRGYRGAAHVVDDWPTMSGPERREVCAAWSHGLAQAGMASNGIRVYRLVLRIDPDHARRPPAVTQRDPQGECQP